jgi:hypothetical protein
VQWRARQEEGVSTQRLTSLTELFEIPHLTNGSAYGKSASLTSSSADVHTPMHKQPLVQTPTISELWRPCLKRDCIANKTCEMLVIQPADCLLVCLNTNSIAVVASTRLSCGFIGVAEIASVHATLWFPRNKYLLVPSHISTPDHQDITLSQRGPLPLQGLRNLFNRNLVPRHWIRRLAILLLVPPHPIAQHTSSDNTTLLAPVVRSIRVGRTRLLVRQTIVIHLTRLVSEVLQTIPLRASLCIDVHFVVHCAKIAERAKVNLFLVEFLAIESGKLDIVQFPVELDTLS